MALESVMRIGQATGCIISILAAAATGCGTTTTSMGNDLALPADGGADLAPGNGGDGGPGRLPPTITMCPGANLPAPASGVCAVTAGDGAKLITGTILTPGEVLRGGQVLIDVGGRIACVGCDCSAMGAGATRIECPKGVVEL